MANAIYGKAKQSYNFPSILTDNIKVVLTRSYTPNFSADEFLSTIPGASRVATSSNLTGKSFTLGVFKAANVVYPSVPSGAACDWLILYQDSGSDATSRLLVGLDSGFSSLPVTPNGTDITVAWASAGIFAL